MKTARAILSLALACSIPATAFGWGDEGHEVVALIAAHYLDPSVAKQVDALLAGDQTQLVTPIDIAHEATWADKYRDSDRNTTKQRYDQTHEWHFVDIEVDGSANLDQACYQHPALPAGTVASAGAAKDCVVDKIDQFAAELANHKTSADERRLALEFVLHFVGDVHQPLHAADDHDQGGNAKTVKTAGNDSGALHAYWDTIFVRTLGADDAAIAASLVGQITPAQQAAWSAGSASDWAQESFQIAKTEAYAKLPTPDADQHYALDSTYADNASKQVAQQLSKAGVRLAMVLNQALGSPAPPTPTGKTVAQLIASARKIAHHYDGTSYLGTLASGDFIFQSKLQLDADGSIYCKQDKDGLPETSLHLSTGAALDANAIPYIVTPLKASAVLKDVASGDVAVLLYGDRTVYAIVGYRGPATKLGEASLAAFRQLGEERIDQTKPHGNYVSKACKALKSDGKEGRLLNQGMASLSQPVTTILFPGSRKEVDRTSVAALMASIEKVADAHWKQVAQ